MVLHGATNYFTSDDTYANDRMLCGTNKDRSEIALASQHAAHADEPHRGIEK
jgi:hypothetical protein